MKLIIIVFAIYSQWRLVTSHPGLIETAEIRKNRDKNNLVNTRTPISSNLISSSENFKHISTTLPTTTTTTNLKPIKLTHDDVVLGRNSFYSSKFQPPIDQFSGGGILFAVSGQPAQNFVSNSAQSQPVIVQYLTPDGMSKQSTVQYVQLLRPLIMLSAPPQFLPSKTLNSERLIETTSEANPFILQKKSSLIGAHSIPLTSYSRPSSYLSLNMNEFVPASSSRVSTTIYTPNATVKNNNMSSFMPISHYQMLSQRA